MKLSLIVLVSTIGFFSNAQYESVFGSQSTSWMSIINFDFGYQTLDSTYHLSDTIIDGQHHYLLSNGQIMKEIQH